eukprot:4050982-Amphidinium_carterae.1
MVLMRRSPLAHLRRVALDCALREPVLPDSSSAFYGPHLDQPSMAHSFSRQLKCWRKVSGLSS